MVSSLKHHVLVAVLLCESGLRKIDFTISFAQDCMKEIVIDNIVYRIGRSAADNTQLIKDSDPEWLWFHLDKFPSCHVVACFKGSNRDIIDKAALLVKEHSKYKFKHIGVNYCKISNLLHGVAAGSVHFVSNKQVLRICV